MSAAPLGARTLLDDGQISDAGLATIYRAADQAYPHECCGFITTSEVRVCRNVIDELAVSQPADFDRTARTGYAFGLTDLRELAESFDGDDPVLIIFHSHPDVGSYFSEEDHRHAVIDSEPIYPVRHLVVDVTANGARGAILFEFCEDTGQFEPCAEYGHPEDRRPAQPLQRPIHPTPARR